MCKRLTHGEVFGSLAMAILIASQYLSTVLGIYISGSESGYFTLIILVVIILSILSLIFSPTRYIYGRYALLFAIINIAYILTVFLASNKSNLLFTDYVGMCLLPFFCGGILKVSYKMVLQLCMFMQIIGLPILGSLFAKSNMGTSYDAIKMSVSYAILPIIGAGVLHFFFFRKESNVIEKILYIITIVFEINFITMSYRGALAAFGLIILAGIMFSGEENWNRKKKSVGGIILVLLLLIIIIIDSNGFLVKIYNYLHAHNIKIAFIDKNEFLSNSDDLTHGRMEIWRAALEGFGNSPLWGHGITTFQYYTGFVFPHNIVLQFLFDGGILLTVPLMYYIVVGIIKTFKIIRNANKEKFVLLLLLICISLTRVMVSAEVWRVMLLWLLLGILSSDKSILKELKSETVKY